MHDPTLLMPAYLATARARGPVEWASRCPQALKHRHTARHENHLQAVCHLTDYLPPDARRANQVELELPDGCTVQHPSPVVTRDNSAA